MRPLAALILMLSGTMLHAEEPAALPDPLSLEQALSLADASSPQVMQAESERDMARANLDATEAENGLNIWAEGRLRWVETPSYSPDKGHDDNKLGVYARKDLYDFGRSSARQGAAEAELRSRELSSLNLHYQRRIEIMQHFFDVLLADMAFAHDDEAMAVAYVTLDKLRKRHELGQVSDIDLAQQEASYQQTRRERAESEAQQRTARELLAITLNHPGQPPANLVVPSFDAFPEKIPDYSELLAEALKNNPQLRALREQLAAAQARVKAARATNRPTLYGEAEAVAYSRHLAANDPLRVGVVLQIPLYTGGATDAAVGQEQARLYRVQAEQQAVENEIRHSVLQLWQHLGLLRIQQEEAQAQLDYRELYLDRSRANYEMEVSTDLGDAMVRLSEAQLAQARARFKLALTWERLRGIMGQAESDTSSSGRKAAEASGEQ